MKSHYLRNRVAIVTGASSGIGRATAFKLAEAGCHVVLASRSLEKLQNLEKELIPYRVGVLAKETDISNADQVKELVDDTLKHFARIDFLINNAGTYFRQPTIELNISDIEKIMQVNFYGSLYCIFTVLPHMLLRRTGHIVVISSIDAIKGLPPDSAYVASKAALTGFAEVLRQELRTDNLYVSTIFPGRVDTPMISNLNVPWISSKISPEKVAKKVVQALQMKKPEIIVPAVNPRILLFFNSISSRLGDWLVKRLRLSGKEILEEKDIFQDSD